MRWQTYRKIEDMTDYERQEHLKKKREKKEIQELDRISKLRQQYSQPKVIIRRANANG